MPAGAPDAAALVRRQEGLRVVVLSSGSRGDVQPLVLLARRLQAQGCAVQALVPANLVRFCEDLGVEARPTFPDLSEVCKQMGGWSLNPEDAGAVEKANAAWMKGHPEVCVDAMRAITEFKPDAVVWNCDGTASLKYEAEMGVPAVEVRCYWDPCPTADRTPARPTFSTLSPLVREMQRCVRVEGAGFDGLNGMYLEDPSHRKFYNIDGSGAICWLVPPKRQWHVGNPKRYDGKATYHAESSNDQLPPRTGWHACDDGNGRPPMPVVRDLDRWLHSLPGLHHTGAWLPADDLQPSEIVSNELGGSMERLLAFLDAGPAPVAIGWGSMLARGMTPAAMVILALRALRACSPSHRAVIVGGWAQLEGALSASSADAACGADEAEVLAELVKSLGGNCCFVAAAPHHWLLPRCSCAVHHGGAGTTQAALHAGCPVVITPISFDQPALAIAVGRLGVGVGFEKPLPSITPGELADAILRAERLAPAAEELGQRLRREKGLAQAAEVLESFLREEVRPGKWRLQWLIQKARLQRSGHPGASAPPAAPGSTMPAAAPDARALEGLRVTVLSAGSRGDVQPLTLLARWLQARGCAVQALVPANHVRFCTDLGVEARPTFPDVSEAWQQMRGWSPKVEDAWAESDAWRSDHLVACMDPLDALREFEPDAVVWNCDGTAPLKYEAEVGVPAVEVWCDRLCGCTADRTPARPTFSTVSPLLQEVWERCVRVEGAGFAELNGMYYRRAAGSPFYHVDGSGAELWFIEPRRQWVVSNPERCDGKATYYATSNNDQLPPEIGWRIADDGNGRQPMPVVRYQGEPVHRQPDIHQTGAWLLGDDLLASEMVSLELDGSMERLLAFLDAGPAPVAICWGSMLARGMTPAAMLILALRALRACSPSHRAVIFGGWAQLEGSLSTSSANAACGTDEAEVLAELVKSLGGNCCFVAAAPHHWLLPLCSCAVHHGGAGTTQAALHAGCRVVITPISFDQPALAAAVGRLGVGVGFEKPLPSIAPGELADAILRAERLAAAAEELGQRLRRERGLAQAAAVLESFLREEVRPGKWRLQWLKVQGEAASAAHMQRQRLAQGHFSKLLSQGKVDQTWIVEKSKSELTVQHNYANGHYRAYKLGSSEEVDQGRWSMHNGEYVQEAGFPVSGTLQGDAKKFWMGVDCGPLGYQKYTPAPFPYIYGYRVCNRRGDVETSIELNQSVLEGILH